MFRAFAGNVHCLLAWEAVVRVNMFHAEQSSERYSHDVWGTADADMKASSAENKALSQNLKAWGKS